LVLARTGLLKLGWAAAAARVFCGAAPAAVTSPTSPTSPASP